MSDKCNCYRFSPRDSLSGAVAQIADYLSKHPGWNETELRTFVDGLISSAGVETFNGRSGNVTLNKDDVNNLLIANCYFAEADETIESIDVLALYKLGIRIVFTQYSSEVDGYTLAYGIEYYPGTDTAKAYLFSSGSGGGTGAIVSVNGKTGTVVLKASDILMNNGDSVEYAVSNAKAIANAAYSPDNPPPYPVTSVNGKTGTVTGLYDKNNPPPYPVNSVNSKTGSVMLKVVDVSNGNSTDENAYMFIDESDDYPDVIASDSSKLGGKAPEYYLQPRNLLDNSDFSNPVNQRNAGTVVNDYIIDRWHGFKTTDGSVTITTEGITATGDGYLQQRLPSGTLKSGKVYTIAVYYLDGTIDVNTNGEYAILDKFDVVNKIKPNGKTIAHIALYEGSYTADTLPPYVPKGYAVELAECRRYFERIGSSFSEQIGNVVYVASGAKSFVCSLQCSRKRIQHPTVTISGVENYRLLLKDGTNANTYSASSISSFDSITAQEPFISFRVNMPNAINQNSWIVLQRADSATAAYIDISADL